MPKTRNQRLNGLHPLSYMGVNPVTPNDFVIETRAPTTNDYDEFAIGDEWLDISTLPTPPGAENLWKLVDKSGGVATWVNFGSGQDILTLTGNTGGAVGVDANDNIFILGADGITVTGTPVNNTLTITGGGGSYFTVQTTDATPTALFTLAVDEGQCVTIDGLIAASKADFSAGIGGDVFGTARRAAAGSLTLIGSPVSSFSEDSAGSPSFDVAVSGNDLLIQVTGEAATVYNWRGLVRINVQTAP